MRYKTLIENSFPLHLQSKRFRLSKLMDACPRLLKIGEVNQWGISMKEAKEVAAQRQWSGTINYTHMQQEVIYDQLN